MKKILLVILISIFQFGFSQSDCETAIPVCGNSNLTYVPSNSGTIDDHVNADGSCLGANEHFSVWYKFTIATSGTLTFTISPNAPYNADYDFAVYGPNVTCAAKGTPIRCNYDGSNPAPNETGLSLDPNIDPFGPWESAMNVNAGETYYLIVDNWSGANAAIGFALTWGGTATLQSPFTDNILTPHPFVPPGNPAADPNNPREITKCVLPTQFDFTTLTNDILNGNQNFVITYHDDGNEAITGTNPITTAMVDDVTIYYYRIKYQDPTNPANPLNNCTQIGKFKFVVGEIAPIVKDLYACNNNGNGYALFNLTQADIFNDPSATIRYYRTMADLNAGTNQIGNITAYNSTAPATVYAKITTTSGCHAIATINLKYYPTVQVYPATIDACFIEDNVGTASFDLHTADVTQTTGVTKKFYPTLNNANAGTNEISNPNAYIATSGEVYVKVIDVNNCYAITKITLKVLPPVKSTLLKDKYICIDARTTLDAGSDFDGYLWSTGATTQSISLVTVGSYWVKLKTGKCYTTQIVNVYPAPDPVIASVDIKDRTVTLNVTGGTPPYLYSNNGTTWQESNVYENVPRGEAKFYVKDASNCTPVSLTVTVPNLVNAITPNGDNVNDFVDYSELSMKKNLMFTIFDRYGNKIFTGEKYNNFRWDGKHYDKKIVTGTYWYTITWNENDAVNTPVMYNGWILVKNRD